LTTFQAILTLDKFPHTVGTYLQYSDINSEQSCHVECVTLMSRAKEWAWEKPLYIKAFSTYGCETHWVKTRFYRFVGTSP